MNDKSIHKDEIQILRIVGWTDHLHPDLTRKVKPSFRWIKLQTENLDMLGDLTLREYGAYCRLLNLAALTDNSLVYKQSAIKRRTGITPKDIENLKDRELIEIRSRSDIPEKSQKNQTDNPETASGSEGNHPQTAAPEGKGFDRKRLDLNTPSPVSDERTPDGNFFNGDFKDLNNALVKAAKTLKRDSIDTDDDELRNQTVAILLKKISDDQWDNACFQVERNGLHYE